MLRDMDDVRALGDWAGYKRSYGDVSAQELAALPRFQTSGVDREVIDRLRALRVDSFGGRPLIVARSSRLSAILPAIEQAMAEVSAVSRRLNERGLAASLPDRAGALPVSGDSPLFWERDASPALGRGSLYLVSALQPGWPCSRSSRRGFATRVIPVVAAMCGLVPICRHPALDPLYGWTGRLAAESSARSICPRSIRNTGKRRLLCFGFSRW